MDIQQGKDNTQTILEFIHFEHDPFEPVPFFKTEGEQREKRSKKSVGPPCF